jgi:signal transduction histidine kinase
MQQASKLATIGELASGIAHEIRNPLAGIGAAVEVLAENRNGHDGEIVSLRRGSCLLHGRGAIGLGGSPADPTSALVRFEVLRFDDTQPQAMA